jgi:Tol biopolymer transport system component
VYASNATAAEVRATATGAVLARIAVPRPYTDFAGVSAAADDRTFVPVAEGTYRAPETSQPNYPPPRFFLLRINPGAAARGARVSLRALPAGFIPANSEVHDLALSPDGTSLAADIGGVFGSNQLFVFDLATGTKRAWSFRSCARCTPTSGGLGFAGTNVGALSWTADGRHLAFVGPGTSTTNAGGGVTSTTPGPVRLLDVRGHGTNLLASSKVVLRWPGGAEKQPAPAWRGVVITPDGRTVVFLEQLVSYKPDGAIENVRQLLAKASVATGKVTAVYKNLKPVGQYQQVMYTNATGSTLVVCYFGLGYGTHVGILRGNEFTPVPWSPHIMTAAW